jgi:hypothetical protein
MTRELIIEGQHVDLAPDTDITLEYVSNIIGDLGKINLSHSYTAKLPKTTRNARILDDPGRPGHESGQTRRFLSARFYRNGIDLIGPAQAYILKTTPDSYEVALVWNTLEALQALSQNPETLNDLPNLPTLTWIGVNGRLPDYAAADEGGAFFAFYNSGLGALKYPTVNTSTHPSMWLRELIERILEGARVPYEISAEASRALEGRAILAAPDHKPSRVQEIGSGSVAEYAAFQTGIYNGAEHLYLQLRYWDEGWDAPQVLGDLITSAADAGAILETGDNDRHRVLVNFQAPAGVDLSRCAICISGFEYDNNMNVTAREELLRAYFKPNDSGWYVFIDEEIKLSGWPRYGISHEYDGLLDFEFIPYDPALPLVAVNRVHDTIDIANDNRFPLQGNLPDIKQWDLIKAAMAMFGLAPTIQSGKLIISTYDELLAGRNAYDWTSKVDMTDGALQDMSYAIDKWAQRNSLTFEDDKDLNFDPTADLVIQDKTLEEHREMFKLPFAASMQSDAQHYQIKEDNKVEDLDISARIFDVINTDNGRLLYFRESMYGQGLIDAHYTRLQEAIRKPVQISVNIRLHEIDLAQMDLTRPVYLGQFGRYYAILKIQTSKTDLCKVELLQIP